MGINIVAAFTNKSFGIGFNGRMPWKITEDLQHFKTLTENKVVVMGRGTWDSLPKKPLPNRMNIIITKHAHELQDVHKYGNSVRFADPDDMDELLAQYDRQGDDVFVIGGERVFADYVGIAKKIYATIIEKDYECDRFFPTKYFDRYEIEEYSPLMFSQESDCYFRYITYTYKTGKQQHCEYQYLDLLKDVMTHGKDRPDRTQIGTRSLFGKQMRFDISKSIPLVTTKFVPWKLTIKELLWFVKGQTDSKILEKQGVNIWRDNTTREFLNKRGLNHYEVGDCGPMYGFNWRHFGAHYIGCHASYMGLGVDQLNSLVDGLKKDPFSRRHMITTYNPNNVDEGVLPPCHGIVVQFYVDEDEQGDKILSCHMYQRSADSFLGLAINIASYSILTYVVAKMVGMKPNELIISTGDTHIYLNHMSQVKEQLERTPLPQPKLIVRDEVSKKSFDELDLSDFDVVGYLHHHTIRAQMAV